MRHANQIMKTLRRDSSCCAKARVARNGVRRFGRECSRERATEIVQQSAAQPRLRPTALHRRRLERLKEQSTSSAIEPAHWSEA